MHKGKNDSYELMYHINVVLLSIVASLFETF